MAKNDVKTTVRVKMLTSVAGLAMPKYGIDREFMMQQGREYTLAQELADKWIDCGHCEPVAEEPAAK